MILTDGLSAKQKLRRRESPDDFLYSPSQSPSLEVTPISDSDVVFKSSGELVLKYSGRVSVESFQESSYTHRSETRPEVKVSNPSIALFNERMFDTWVKINTAYLFKIDENDGAYAESIRSTSSYLKALRSDILLKKFLSKYLLLLKVNYGEMDKVRAERLGMKLSGMKYHQIDDATVDKFFNIVRNIGLPLS